MRRMLAGSGMTLPLGGGETVLMTPTVALSAERKRRRHAEHSAAVPSLAVYRPDSFGRLSFQDTDPAGYGEILEKLGLYLGVEALLSGGVRLVEPCRAQGFQLRRDGPAEPRVRAVARSRTLPLAATRTSAACRRPPTSARPGWLRSSHVAQRREGRSPLIQDRRKIPGNAHGRRLPGVRGATGQPVACSTGERVMAQHLGCDLR
jgi:hypothetical protein